MELTSNQDAVLAAFLEPGALPDIAKRVNMNLAALATWASKHADLLDNVHKLLVTRCKLIKAHLELASLTALAKISSATTDTDDPKLRERALERQRKAAVAILRHHTGLQRASGLAPSPRIAGRSVIDAVDDDEGRSALSTSRTTSATSPNAALSLDALMPAASMPSSSRVRRKPSISERLAARRLAALAAT